MLLSLLFVAMFMGGFYLIFRQGDVGSVRQVENLPWQIKVDDAHETRVFGVSVGESTLSEMGQVFGKIPELAIFQKNTGVRELEAYFSRLRIGMLQANIVAVLDIDGESLSAYADFERVGKPMPSGQRKYVLSLSGLKAAGDLIVWKLAYIPVVDYTDVQLLKFFGQPEQKTTLSANSQYWHYPEKALLIAYNTEGKEIFHYTSKQHYKRLMEQLLEVLDEK